MPDPMQLVDELGMIYTTCLMMYASFSFQRSATVARWLAFGLLALAAFITVSAHRDVPRDIRMCDPPLTESHHLRPTITRPRIRYSTRLFMLS